MRGYFFGMEMPNALENSDLLADYTPAAGLTSKNKNICPLAVKVYSLHEGIQPPSSHKLQKFKSLICV